MLTEISQIDKPIDINIIRVNQWIAALARASAHAEMPGTHFLTAVVIAVNVGGEFVGVSGAISIGLLGSLGIERAANNKH
jgi:hypothetical protein